MVGLQAWTYSWSGSIIHPCVCLNLQFASLGLRGAYGENVFQWWWWCFLLMPWCLQKLSQLPARRDDWNRALYDGSKHWSNPVPLNQPKSVPTRISIAWFSWLSKRKYVNSNIIIIINRESLYFSYAPHSLLPEQAIILAYFGIPIIKIGVEYKNGNRIFIVQPLAWLVVVNHD